MPIFTHDTLNHFIRISVLRVRIWFLAGAVFSQKVVVVTIILVQICLILQ